MGISSYSELQTAVADYMHRQNLSDKIPDFIALAEAEMARLLRVWKQQSYASLSLTAGSPTVTLPTGTKEVISAKLAGANEREMRKMPLAALNHKYAGAVAGVPKDFSFIEGNMTVAPTPSADGTIEALILKKTNPLSNVDTTNVILQNYSDLYLYGAAKHGFAYIHHPERMRDANEMFMSGIDEANRESIKVQASGVYRPPYRMSTGRIV